MNELKKNFKCSLLLSFTVSIFGCATDVSLRDGSIDANADTNENSDSDDSQPNLEIPCKEPGALYCSDIQDLLDNGTTFVKNQCKEPVPTVAGLGETLWQRVQNLQTELGLAYYATGGPYNGLCYDDYENGTGQIIARASRECVNDDYDENDAHQYPYTDIYVSYEFTSPVVDPAFELPDGTLPPSHSGGRTYVSSSGAVGANVIVDVYRQGIARIHPNPNLSVFEGSTVAYFSDQTGRVHSKVITGSAISQDTVVDWDYGFCPHLVEVSTYTDTDGDGYFDTLEIESIEP